jgi:hypothetical protein
LIFSEITLVFAPLWMTAISWGYDLNHSGQDFLNTMTKIISSAVRGQESGFGVILVLHLEYKNHLWNLKDSATTTRL